MLVQFWDIFGMLIFIWGQSQLVSSEVKVQTCLKLWIKPFWLTLEQDCYTPFLLRFCLYFGRFRKAAIFCLYFPSVLSFTLFQTMFATCFIRSQSQKCKQAQSSGLNLFKLAPNFNVKAHSDCLLRFVEMMIMMVDVKINPFFLHVQIFQRRKLFWGDRFYWRHFAKRGSRNASYVAAQDKVDSGNIDKKDHNDKMNVAPYCSNIHHQSIDHIYQLIIEFNRLSDVDDTAIPHLTIFGALKHSQKYGQLSQIQQLTCVAPVQR